jgi:hypothetical protein
MDEDRVRDLVRQLDTTRVTDTESAWGELRDLGEALLPYLVEAYPSMKRWQGRVALVYYAIPYARTNRAAFELGLAALTDRATLVRYRACMLLAYSLDPEAIPSLERLLSHPDAKTVDDARAAIDAIEFQNHHYFLDRHHTGRLRWEPDPPAPEDVSAYDQADSSEVAEAKKAGQATPPDGVPRNVAVPTDGCAGPVLLALGIAGSVVWLTMTG